MCEKKLNWNVLTRAALHFTAEHVRGARVWSFYLYPFFKRHAALIAEGVCEKIPLLISPLFASQAGERIASSFACKG